MIQIFEVSSYCSLLLPIMVSKNNMITHTFYPVQSPTSIMVTLTALPFAVMYKVSLDECFLCLLGCYKSPAVPANLKVFNIYLYKKFYQQNIHTTSQLTHTVSMSDQKPYQCVLYVLARSFVGIRGISSLLCATVNEYQFSLVPICGIWNQRWRENKSFPGITSESCNQFRVFVFYKIWKPEITLENFNL